MKYMLLIYYDEKVLEKVGKAEEAHIESECLKHCEELGKEGKFLGGNRLHSVSTATSVRAKDGKAFITDGPFAETREQLGGYCIIDAKNLDEAIAFTSHMPQLRLGTVEIRPVMEFGLAEAALKKSAS
ncbi:MAG: YciI family protein [bacterium]